MRNQFLGHFKLTEDEIKDIWENATFVFDANILLNLYRYSDDTRDEFLKLLGNLKSRVWLPEQAAYEYLKNRASVIAEQVRAYKENALKVQKLNDLNDLFSSKRAHPFISSVAKEKYDAAVDTIKAEMLEKQQRQEALLTDDPIQNQIANIFEAKIGKPYLLEDIKQIFDEGAERFSENTPPGYMDSEKFIKATSVTDKRSNCGDLIVWKQVIDHANEAQCAIVFVTDDQKEDWWTIANGKTIGPRPELIKEFFEETKQQILIYKPELFLKLSKTHLDEEISKKSIDEITSERHSRLEQEELTIRNGSAHSNWTTFPARERGVLPQVKMENRSTSETVLKRDLEIQQLMDEQRNLEQQLGQMRDQYHELLIRTDVVNDDNDFESEVDMNLLLSELGRKRVELGSKLVNVRVRLNHLRAKFDQN